MSGSRLEKVPDYCGMLSKPFRPDELIAALQGCAEGTGLG